jgi:hypothetical protein
MYTFTFTMSSCIISIIFLVWINCYKSSSPQLFFCLYLYNTVLPYKIGCYLVLSFYLSRLHRCGSSLLWIGPFKRGTVCSYTPHRNFTGKTKWNYENFTRNDFISVFNPVNLTNFVTFEQLYKPAVRMQFVRRIACRTSTWNYARGKAKNTLQNVTRSLGFRTT